MARTRSLKRRSEELRRWVDNVAVYFVMQLKWLLCSSAFLVPLMENFSCFRSFLWTLVYQLIKGMTKCFLQRDVPRLLSGCFYYVCLNDHPYWSSPVPYAIMNMSPEIYRKLAGTHLAEIFNWRGKCKDNSVVSCKLCLQFSDLNILVVFNGHTQ